jgi:hypothetical protein
MLPAAVAAETVPGGHVPITYLPGKPEYAAYGVVQNELFDWNILPPSVLIAIVAAFVFQIVRKRDKLADYRREHGAGPFVVCALLCLLAAFPCFNMTSGFFGWEYGIMTGDRRATPSELEEVQIKDGHYHAKFLITLEDGRSAWRTRQFTESEIDDAGKMKVGRKFDVVYLHSDPSYNRPDFAEAYHAPRRKTWLALYLLAFAGIWGVALWALYWAFGGPKSPSLFHKQADATPDRAPAGPSVSPSRKGFPGQTPGRIVPR